MAENAYFTVCTSRLSPSLIHGLCATFASDSRFMRPFQAALDNCVDSPFFASLSVHGLHFPVYAPSNFKSLAGWISKTLAAWASSRHIDL